MEEQERVFKGVWIPKEIWFDTRLNALEKVILIEIDSLDNENKGGCIAGNDYLAEFCQCSERKVSDSISKLIKLGYIFVRKFDGRTRYLGSRLAKSAGQTSKICEAETQNLRHNNIKNNINDNIRDRFTPPTIEEIEEYAKERNSNIDAKKFYDYYTADKDPKKHWTDSNGKKVKNWKQKFITWENHSEKLKNEFIRNNYTKTQINGFATNLDEVEI